MTDVCQSRKPWPSSVAFPTCKLFTMRRTWSYPPTSPNTAPATKNDSHDWSASHMKRYLQCAEQLRLPSNITKYCPCHEKSVSWLIRVTYETLATMREATKVTLQHHQILHLLRKRTRQNFREISRKQLKRHLQCGPDPTMIRAWNRQSPTRLATEVTFLAHHEHFLLQNTMFRARAIIPNFTKCCTCHEKWHLNFTKYCACHEKWLPWLSLVTYETLFTMCGNWGYPPTSPNTAPATKNDSHDWSASHMKRYLQWAEQLRLPSNITKYFACHEKWISWLLRVTYETLVTMREATKVTLQHHQILRLPRKMALQNFREISRKQLRRHLQCGTDPTIIRPWSEHETVSPQPASQPRLLFALTTSIFYWKIKHFALRLPFQILPNIAPATKSDGWTSTSAAPATKSDSCSSPNIAPATKSDGWTSPNTAPATKSDTWTLPNSAPATKSDTWTSPNSAPAMKSDTWTSPNIAPAKKSDTWTSPNILLLYSTVLYSALLYYSLLYSTLLYPTLLFATLLYSTLLYYSLLYSALPYPTLLSLTLLFSDSSILDSAVSFVYRKFLI